MKYILLVGIGSFFGGVTRYLLSRFVDSFMPAILPFGTFVVNIVGCFLVTFLYELFSKGLVTDEGTRIMLTVGFCGGLTTFSTFVHQNYILFKDDDFWRLLIYATVSFIFGMIASHLGHLCAKNI